MEVLCMAAVQKTVAPVCVCVGDERGPTGSSAGRQQTPQSDGFKVSCSDVSGNQELVSQDHSAAS